MNYREIYICNHLTSLNPLPVKMRLKRNCFMTYILKPIWFLAFQKTKSWLQLSPDKRRRGLYSGKIVFGFFRK